MRGKLAGCGKLGVKASPSLQKVANSFDVLIDFTNPQLTLQNLAACAQLNKAMVIGTTGLDEAQKAYPNPLYPIHASSFLPLI